MTLHVERFGTFVIESCREILPGLAPWAAPALTAIALGLIAALLLLMARKALHALSHRAPSGVSRLLGVMAPVLRVTPRIGLILAMLLPLAVPMEAVALWSQATGLTGLILITWALHRAAGRLEELLGNLTQQTRTPWDDFALHLARRLLQGLIPLAAFWIGVRMLADQPALHAFSDRLMGVAVVMAIAWTAIQAIHLAERLLVTPEELAQADNLVARRRMTQIMVLRRIAYVLVGIFTLASLLMQFEAVRQLGTSLLASAGVASLVLGIAAQRTLANLLAGVQIALTQPIRLDDVVIVEGEWGRIEDITLTYVVVALWDQRRLVVPISYFIEKPFQNWTRTSAEILGTVTLRARHGIPVDEVRTELQRLVHGDPRWDGRVAQVQMTEAAEHSIELRILISARDASAAWDLRCHLREHLVTWLAQRPDATLPVLRLANPQAG